MLKSYPLGVKTTAGAITIASLALAIATCGTDDLRKVGVAFALIASGPIGGWFLAIHYHSLFSALWSLLPLTGFTIVPLLIALRQPARRAACFAIAGIAWLIAGVLYGIAIWV
jgi:hypothetical protein